MSCCCWPKNNQDHDIQTKSPIIKLIHKIKKQFSPIPIIKKNTKYAKYPKNCKNCNSVYYRDAKYCCGECKFSTLYGSFNSDDSCKSPKKYFTGYNSS